MFEKFFDSSADGLARVRTLQSGAFVLTQGRRSADATQVRRVRSLCLMCHL